MLRSFASIVAGLSLGFLVQSAPTASAQSVTTSTATSQSYVCPKCGRVHARRPANSVPSTQPVTSQYSSTPVTQTSYAPTTYAAPTSGGGNVLSMLNAQRARQGVPSLMYDPALQSVAQRRANHMAATGNKSHPPGSFAPGRYEGVGWSSSYSPRSVYACYTSDRRMRYAGAAMARGRDGVYFAVVYR